jgi:hypothetical protein
MQVYKSGPFEVWVSHCLANLARTEHSTIVWPSSGLDVVIQELEHELVIIPTFNKRPLYPKKYSSGLCKRQVVQASAHQPFLNASGIGKKMVLLILS